MSSSESIRLQLNEKEIRHSSIRQTPLTSFAEQFKAGLATGTRVVGNMAQTAGYAIPGAAVVSAAISSAGTVKSAGDGTGAVVAGGVYGNSAGTGFGTPGVGVGGTGSANMDSVANRAAGGDAPSQMMMATREMQEMNQSFNLQYLQLQEKMQHESRAFTTMSNVMKTKHDNARNTLSNLK